MLTLKWSDKTAMLVETVAGKRRHKPIPVTDAQAALAWCEQHHAAFWYQPQPDPAAN